MKTKEDYNKFLSDVRSASGIESLTPDESGLVSVRVDDAYNVNLQFVEATGKVLCFVEVATLPPDASKAVYRDLLVGGLFGKDTAGGYGVRRVQLLLRPRGGGEGRRGIPPHHREDTPALRNLGGEDSPRSLRRRGGRVAARRCRAYCAFLRFDDPRLKFKKVWRGDVTFSEFACRQDVGTVNTSMEKEQSYATEC